MHADDADQPLSILLLNHTWFSPELRAAGHRVVTAGWAHGGFDLCFSRLTDIRDVLVRLAPDFVPSHIVYFDDSHTVSLVGLENVDIPVVFLSIDIHHHLLWHRYLVDIVDFTLAAQRDYVDSMRTLSPGAPVEWFPLWAPLDIAPAAERDIPVSFRGTMDPELHPVRREFFDAVRNRIEIDAAPGPYREIYARSRIVLNQSVGNDLNFRVFEALMAGALLITPRVSNGFSDLFVEGTHLIAYPNGDVDEAVRLVRHYLAHPDEAEKIARAGRDLVVEKHCASRRATELVALLRGVAKRAKRRAEISGAALLLSAVSSYRKMPLNDYGRNPYQERLLERASELLIARDAASEPTDESRALIFLCVCFLEHCQSRDEAILFLERTCSRFPNDIVLRLCLTEKLIGQNRRPEAERLAEQLSHTPDELLASLPGLLGKAREQVMATLGPTFAEALAETIS